MSLTRALLITAAIAARAPCAHSQNAAQPVPSFAIASVKPSEPAAYPRIRMGPTPGGQGYEARNIAVRFMIERVFNLVDDQISGGPGWMNTERYDIEAKADRPSSIDELHMMFQSLLADRFKLQFHRETRELPLFELTIDKNGPKLTVNRTADPYSGTIGPNVFKPGIGGLPGMTGVGTTMSALCWSLSHILARPVVDKTGLKGYYDFKLEYVMTGPPAPSAPIADGGDLPPHVEGPSIFSAVREQLGLKLEARKGPVEILVIDHIEKPSSN